VTINRAMDRDGWLKPGRSGGAILRTANPYGNPCPDCGARRYERCFKYHRRPKDMRLSQADIANGASEDGDFIYIKDKPCKSRVTLYLGIDNELHPRRRVKKGMVEDNDYSGGDL